MNPIPAPIQNNPKTRLLIAVMQHITDSDYLDRLAVDYFDTAEEKALVEDIFKLEEEKESDNLEPLDNPKGRTIKDLIRLLLADREVDINVTDSTGWPLIFFAVEKLEVLEMLFQARPELANSFSTIIGIATNGSHNITWNVFHWANSKKLIKSLIFLANKLSEPAATAKKREIIGWFLAQDLTQPSNQENFLELLNAFALPSAEMNVFLFEAITTNTTNAVIALTVLLKAPNIDVNDLHEGMTALTLAAREGYVQAIRVLLETPGINLDAVNAHGMTAFMLAAYNGNVEVIRVFLGIPGIKVNAVNRIGATVLMLAASDGHADVISALLATSGIDVNAVDHHGKTALMYAVQSGQMGAIRVLLGVAGINVNAFNHRMTALTLAAREGYVEAIRMLLGTRGINFEIANQGVIALTLAAEHGHTSAICVLLTAHDIDVNAVGGDGRTALMWVARNGHLEALATLLAAPALDLTLHDQARNAIFSAEKRNNFECSRLIQAALDAAAARPPQPLAEPIVQPVAQPPANSDKLSTLGGSLVIGIAMYFWGNAILSTAGFYTGFSFLMNLATYSALTLGASSFVIAAAVGFLSAAYFAPTNANVDAYAATDSYSLTEEQREQGSRAPTLRFSQAAGNPVVEAPNHSESVSLMLRQNLRP